MHAYLTVETGGVLPKTTCIETGVSSTELAEHTRREEVRQALSHCFTTLWMRPVKVQFADEPDYHHGSTKDPQLSQTVSLPIIDHPKCR